jgi:hypothetical protein
VAKKSTARDEECVVIHTSLNFVYLGSYVGFHSYLPSTENRTGGASSRGSSLEHILCSTSADAPARVSYCRQFLCSNADDIHTSFPVLRKEHSREIECSSGARPLASETLEREISAEISQPLSTLSLASLPSSASGRQQRSISTTT